MKGLGRSCSPTMQSCISFPAWLSVGLVFVSLLPCVIPSACAWPFWLPLPTHPDSGLEISIKSDSSEVIAGERLGYICILRNVGDKTLSNISVNDGTNEIGYRDTLAPGDVFRIKAKTPPLTRSSRFMIKAISDGKEMASQEMSVLVREKDTKPLQNPSLIATVEAGRISALSSYKIKIANLGNDELSRVKILDSRNNALGIIPSRSRRVSYTFAELQIGWQFEDHGCKRSWVAYNGRCAIPRLACNYHLWRVHP